MRRVALLLLLAVVATGCSSQAAPRASRTTPQASQPTAAPSDATGGSVDAAPSPTRTAGKKAGTTKRYEPPDGIPSGPHESNTMDLAVSLDRTCVLTGQPLTVTIESEPRAALGMAVAYPDNSIVPDYNFVSKDDNETGSYTWRFAVRSTVKGDGFVNVTASKEGRGASFDAPFRIASTC